SFRNCGDQDWRFAYYDRFAASLRMAGRVFHARFDQYTRGALRQGFAGEIRWQLQIEVINSLSVRFAMNRAGLHEDHVDAGCFYVDVTVLDGFAEEVVGADSSRYMITRTIAMFVRACKVDRDLELRQHISFHVQRQFRSARVHERF